MWRSVSLRVCVWLWLCVCGRGGVKGMATRMAGKPLCAPIRTVVASAGKLMRTTLCCACRDSPLLTEVCRYKLYAVHCRQADENDLVARVLPMLASDNPLDAWHDHLAKEDVVEHPRCVCVFSFLI